MCGHLNGNVRLLSDREILISSTLSSLVLHFCDVHQGFSLLLLKYLSFNIISFSEIFRREYYFFLQLSLPTFIFFFFFLLSQESPFSDGCFFVYHLSVHFLSLNILRLFCYFHILSFKRLLLIFLLHLDDNGFSHSFNEIILNDLLISTVCDKSIFFC